MRNRDLFQQPFSFDPSKLDEDQEIRFDYDNQGRLVRIRKERRLEDRMVKILLWVAAVIILVIVIFPK